MSRRAFSRWKAAFWFFAALWLALALTVAFWLPVGTVWKGALLVLLAILVPPLSDLFESYDSFSAPDFSGQ